MQRVVTVRSAAGRLRVIKTECAICEAYDPASGKPHPNVLNYVGIWDTGATGTVVTKKVADDLKLPPIGKVKVYHADGEGWANVYLVNLLLRNGVGFKSLRVTEGKLNGADVLIGMDVITQGDFAVTNLNGNTTFSFGVPSQQEIDFSKSAVPPSSPAPAKVGNNDKCPCGSGKKYKLCHKGKQLPSTTGS